MFSEAVETAAVGPDWLTIGIALVTGLLGGVAGAWIAAGTQRTLAHRSARREASNALWSYHRVLHDYALELENDLTHEGTAITNTTNENIAAARAEAYPYRSYIGKGSTGLLSRQLLPYWDPSIDPMTVSNDLWKWAKDLEKELIRVFGNDKH